MFFKIRNLRFRASALLAFLVVSLIFGAFPASACGCGLVVVSSDNGWSYGDDSTEQSFINFEDNSEKLIISLDIKNRSHDAVLVIPVPATANSVKADVLSQTPRFTGYDVAFRAHQKLSDIRDVLLLTQVYPIVPIVILSAPRLGEATPEIGAVPMKLGTDVRSIGQDIVVYQHLEKEGMVAEVLSAANSDSLYDYLSQKGLKVEKDSIPIFRDYIHQDFSFVAAWISPSASNVGAKGLLMSFPTKKIFYPLKPGSVYSGSGMEKTITVVGHVSPKLYAGIEDSTKVNYYYSPDSTSFKDFFSSTKTGFGFTRIVLNAEPKQYNQDLEISTNTPIKILHAQFINLYPFVYGLIWLIILTTVSTFLAVRLVLSSLQQPSISYVRLGILNGFTLIGTVIGARFFLRAKRFKFVVSYSAIFVALVMLTWFLFSTTF